MNLVIGSGNIHQLMSGIKTKGHQDLLRSFVSEDKPYYNALASPLDAARTGAILEDRFQLALPEDFYIQYKATFDEMDIFTSSLDFAKISNNKVINFIELKTIFFTEFIDEIYPLLAMPDFVSVLKRKYKKYYNQVQCQLMCTGLSNCTLAFLPVYSYNDDENKQRIIELSEVATFIINRDEDVISEIKQRGEIFQNIKDYFNK